jgi:hypothetical protein
MSAKQSMQSAIPVGFLPRLSFWAIVVRPHDRHPLRRQGDDPPVVSPAETDTHAVQAKLGCEAPQLAAELPAGLWPFGRCSNLLADDVRKLGVQRGGRAGPTRYQAGDLEQGRKSRVGRRPEPGRKTDRSSSETTAPPKPGTPESGPGSPARGRVRSPQLMKHWSREVPASCRAAARAAISRSIRCCPEEGN